MRAGLVEKGSQLVALIRLENNRLNRRVVIGCGASCSEETAQRLYKLEFADVNGWNAGADAVVSGGLRRATTTGYFRPILRVKSGLNSQIPKSFTVLQPA